MRARIKRHCHALLTSVEFVGMALVLTFFFYDGPLRPPELISSALATDNAVKVKVFQTETKPSLEAPVFLSEGKPLGWRHRSLDNAVIKLNTLEKPLTLAQTTEKSGVEAFEYASYLYGQMAQEIKDGELATQFKTLKLKTEAMGQAVRQASALRFDGPPGEDMAHLQVRSALLSYLGRLNDGALITARYNQKGILLEENRAKSVPGQALTSYLNSVDQLLSHPAARQYPDTMRLVSQESELLAQLAQNMTLRWENTLYCPSRCEDVAILTRIYARQMLPDHTLISASL